MCLCRQLLDYLLQPFRVLAPTLSAGELPLRKIEGPDRGSTIGLYYAVIPTRIGSPSRNLVHTLNLESRPSNKESKLPDPEKNN